MGLKIDWIQQQLERAFVTWDLIVTWENGIFAAFFRTEKRTKFWHRSSSGDKSNGKGGRGRDILGISTNDLFFPPRKTSLPKEYSPNGARRRSPRFGGKEEGRDRKIPLMKEGDSGDKEKIRGEDYTCMKKKKGSQGATDFYLKGDRHRNVGEEDTLDSFWEV